MGRSQNLWQQLKIQPEHQFLEWRKNIERFLVKEVSSNSLEPVENSSSAFWTNRKMGWTHRVIGIFSPITLYISLTFKTMTFLIKKIKGTTREKITCVKSFI